MKSFALISLLLLLFLSNLHAQTQTGDSLTIVSQANTDAQNFKLNKVDLKIFRKHRADFMAQYSPNRNPVAALPHIFTNPVTPAGVSKVRDAYNHVDYTSDYFKPTKATTKDTALLNDSVYVKAFRDAAYKRTAQRRTAGHYIAIYGGVAAAIAIVVGIFALAAAMGG